MRYSRDVLTLACESASLHDDLCILSERTNHPCQNTDPNDYFHATSLHLVAQRTTNQLVDAFFVVLVDCNLLLRDVLCVILGLVVVRILLHLENVDSFVLVDIIGQV